MQIGQVIILQNDINFSETPYTSQIDIKVFETPSKCISVSIIEQYLVMKLYR